MLTVMMQGLLSLGCQSRCAACAQRPVAVFECRLERLLDLFESERGVEDEVRCWCGWRASLAGWRGGIV